MFLKLAVLFIVVPWLELTLLLRIGGTLGWAGTLAVIVLTGGLGAALARHEGVRALQRIRAALQNGQLPATEVMEGALILVAGVVLLTPGFITDLAGFMLLIPPLRRSVCHLLIRHLKGRFSDHANSETCGNGHGRGPQDPAVIDVSAGSVEDVDGR